MLSGLPKRFIRNGVLTLIDAAGAENRLGGPGPGPEVTPRLSDPRLGRDRLRVADSEVLRLRCFHTLRHSRERFTASRDKAAALHDERLCRMWEWHLAAVEVGFLNGTNMVFQIPLSTRIDAVPIVRDGMLDQARQAGRGAGAQRARWPAGSSKRPAQAPRRCWRASPSCST